MRACAKCDDRAFLKIGFKQKMHPIKLPSPVGTYVVALGKVLDALARADVFVHGVAKNRIDCMNKWRLAVPGS